MAWTQMSKKVAMELVGEAAVFLGCTAAVALLYRRPCVLAAVMAATAAVALFAWPNRRLNLTILAVGAVVGGVGETVCSNAGAWQYAHPTFLGIPLWLPVAWGLVVVLIRRVADTLTRLTG